MRKDTWQKRKNEMEEMGVKKEVNKKMGMESERERGKGGGGKGRRGEGRRWNYLHIRSIDSQYNPHNSN